MKTTIDVYGTTTIEQECRLYDSDIRTLFRLPKRKGKIEAVVLNNGCLIVKFVQARNNYRRRSLLK